jgi:hypothetical protein
MNMGGGPSGIGTKAQDVQQSTSKIVLTDSRGNIQQTANAIKETVEATTKVGEAASVAIDKVAEKTDRLIQRISSFNDAVKGVFGEYSGVKSGMEYGTDRGTDFANDYGGGLAGYGRKRRGGVSQSMRDAVAEYGMQGGAESVPGRFAGIGLTSSMSDIGRAALGTEGFGAAMGIGRLAGSVALMAVGGAYAAGKEYVSGYTGPQALAAERNMSVAGSFQRAWGRDYNFVASTLSAAGDSDFNTAVQGDVARALRGTDAVFGTVRNVFSKLSLGAIGPSGDPGLAKAGITGGLTDTHLGTKGGQAGQDFINDIANSNPLLRKMAWDQFAGQQEHRQRMQMVLGTGLGAFGKNGAIVDTHGGLEARLAGQGFSLGELASAQIGAWGQVGRGAGSGELAGRMMSANVVGAGAWGGVASAAARASGSIRQGIAGADYALGSGIDPYAGLNLGQVVYGSGFDPMGTTNRQGVMAAVQAGFNFSGGVADFNMVNRVAGGLQAGNQIVSGNFDPYQKGRNLVSAIGIAPDAGVYGQDYLATGMNFQQMLDISSGRSGSTNMMRSLGLTQGDVKKQMYASFDSMVERWKDDGSSRGTLRQTMKELQESGLGATEWIQGVKSGKIKSSVGALTASRDLASFYQTQGFSEEEAIGAASLQSGFGASRLSSGRIGGGLREGSAESEAAKAEAKKRQTLADELTGSFGQLVQSIKKAPDVGKAFESYGQNLNATVDTLITSLRKLVAAVDPAAAALMKKQEEKEANVAAANQAANNKRHDKFGLR